MIKMNAKKIKILVILAVIVIAVIITIVLIIGRIRGQNETPIGTHPEEFLPGPGAVSAVHFSKLVPFLPDPPSGWVGEEPYGETVTSGGWTWSTADRRYTKPDTEDASITIVIVDDAYFAGVWLWMREGFYEFESIDEYSRNISFKGHPAWEERVSPDHYTLHVNIDNRFVVSISGNGIDQNTLSAFADKIDYSGIAALK